MFRVCRALGFPCVVFQGSESLALLFFWVVWRRIWTFTQSGFGLWFEGLGPWVCVSDAS